MNHQDIKPKRENASLPYNIVMSDQALEILVFHALYWQKMVILKKLSLFFGNKRQEIRIYSLTYL